MYHVCVIMIATDVEPSMDDARLSVCGRSFSVIVDISGRYPRYVVTSVPPVMICVCKWENIGFAPIPGDVSMQITTTSG